MFAKKKQRQLEIEKQQKQELTDKLLLEIDPEGVDDSLHEQPGATENMIQEGEYRRLLNIVRDKVSSDETKLSEFEALFSDEYSPDKMKELQTYHEDITGSLLKRGKKATMAGVDAVVKSPAHLVSKVVNPLFDNIPEGVLGSENILSLVKEVMGVENLDNLVKGVIESLLGEGVNIGSVMDGKQFELFLVRRNIVDTLNDDEKRIFISKLRAFDEKMTALTVAYNKLIDAEKRRGTPIYKESIKALQKEKEKFKKNPWPVIDEHQLMKVVAQGGGMSRLRKIFKKPTTQPTTQPTTPVDRVPLNQKMKDDVMALGYKGSSAIMGLKSHIAGEIGAVLLNMLERTLTEFFTEAKHLKLVGRMVDKTEETGWRKDVDYATAPVIQRSIDKANLATTRQVPVIP